MLYLSTTHGVVRVDAETGKTERPGAGADRVSVEGLAVAAGGETMVAAVTPDYGVPMRDPLRPAHARGAMRSADGGQTWAPVDGLSGQQVTALAAVGGGFLAGTDPAELLHSEDGGETWQRGQSLREMPGYERWTYPGVPHTPHVMLIAPHPTEPKTIYAGIEVGGIVRSDDGGATWRVIGAGMVHPDIHGIAISPSQTNVLYAATPNGVYRSADGGETWEHRSTGLERLYCRPIVVHQKEPERAVVVSTHGASGFFGIPAARTGGQVNVTDDGGKTWRQVSRGVPEPLQPTASMAADKQRSGRFYLPLFSGELLVSDDAGESWEVLVSGLPPILRVVAT